jgi:hypothetical protein
MGEKLGNAKFNYLHCHPIRRQDHDGRPQGLLRAYFNGPGVESEYFFACDRRLKS